DQSHHSRPQMDRHCDGRAGGALQRVRSGRFPVKSATPPQLPRCGDNLKLASVLLRKRLPVSWFGRIFAPRPESKEELTGGGLKCPLFHRPFHTKSVKYAKIPRPIVSACARQSS